MNRTKAMWLLIAITVIGILTKMDLIEMLAARKRPTSQLL